MHFVGDGHQSQDVMSDDFIVTVVLLGSNSRSGEAAGLVVDRGLVCPKHFIYRSLQLIPIVLERRRHWGWAIALAVLLTFLCWKYLTPSSTDPRHGSSSPLEGNLETSQLNQTFWPQLRGPTFDSISAETGLADSWPEGGPPLVWMKELGQGYSSFTAVGNRVFTQTQNLYQQSVVCLDSATGDTVWTHHYGWPYDGGGLYPGPRSTPTWHNGRLYFAAPDGMISCVIAGNGKQVWSCNPKKKYRGLGTDFGYASSPVIIDGRLIVPVGGQDASVVAIDPRDGSTIWASGESSASYATPLPIDWHGRSLVVTPLENSIALFDVATGKQQWEIEFSQGYDEHSAAPIYKEPFLFVASPFKAGAKCYRLVEADRAPVVQKTARELSTDNAADSDHDQLGTPVVAWETLKFSNDVASSVLVDGRVYGFDLKDPQSRLNRPSRGEFRCLDFETGRIIWSTNKVGQANIIAADHKLILFTDSGELILARSGSDEYTELARTQVFQDEICWTYPTLHHGCVYLRTQTRAACLYIGQAPYDAKHAAHSVQTIPRVHALDAKRLVGGEREYPATAPDWIEFLAWYKWSLAGIVFASLAAAVSNLPTRGSIITGRFNFWLTTIIVGMFGSPVINGRQSEYVLLWPLVLWAAFQLTINVITLTEQSHNKRSYRWLSRSVGLLFIGTCALYFHLCRSLGYAIEWSFLTGFLPAFAVVAIASRYLTKKHRYWLVSDLVVTTISFSAYFWFSVIYIKWKLIVGS